MYFLTYFLVIVSIIVIALTSKSKARKTSKLPPGPIGLPIIGNILDLGPMPHRSLAKLSRKYGPVISLKLGTITTVVVSTPETAKAVLQTHDLSFSGRPTPLAVRALNHHEFSMSWLPVGKQWRKLRKICRELMFSAARLDAGQDLRREKLQKLHDYVSECSEAGRAVDVGEAAFTTSLNLLGSTIFSTDLAGFGSDSSQEFKDAVWGAMKCGGTPNLADYFPVLESVDPQRIFKQSTIYFGKLLAIFGEIIDERLKSGSQKIDFIGALIDQLHQRDEPQLSREDINHLLLVLFIAGTDTTLVTIDWAMAELMRNPEKMARVRNEIRDVKQENGQIQESDIPRFPYLQAVVKETFRLHPPAPLMLPHKAVSEVEINGFIVPQTAQVFVNVWASGRDPNIWPNASAFEPERFLIEGKYPIDFRGKDFELIPFGAGRRICPGLPLAHRMVHLILATLVGNFEWKVEGVIEPEEINMDEMFGGVTLGRAIPLRAVPTKL